MSKEPDVTNPFEDENGIYHVLINDEGQHSLWPSFIEVPEGWTIVHKEDSRAACLEFINRNWTDMRPNSLIRSMQEAAKQDRQKEGPAAGSNDAGSGTLTVDSTSKH
jgi:MbtH protein